MKIRISNIVLAAALAFIAPSISVAQSVPAASPLRYGIVLDCSASSGVDPDYFAAAAIELVSANRPTDRTFIMSFADKDSTTLEQVATDNKRYLHRALKRLPAAHGEAAIIDAVYLAAAEVLAPAANPNSALVLISDGDERSSTIKSDILLAYLRDKKIPVYVLAFANTVKKQHDPKHYEKAVEFLAMLANASGGKVVVAHTLDELKDHASDIAHLLQGR
ncbi:MAG TPA: VWA domain-containing protein [Geobacteraceae bacterium]